MTTEFDKDKVMSRVRKMLALANDAAATEGERDNALRMAHATLAKYNLIKTEKSRTRSGDAAAFHEGRQYGDGIGLQSQVSSSTKPHKEIS